MGGPRVTDRYAVVGCRPCRALWVRDTTADARETRSTCPRCGTEHTVDSRRVFDTFEDAPTARAYRSAVLKARSDAGDVHIGPTSYGEQAAAVESHLEAGYTDFADAEARVEAFVERAETTDAWWQAQERERRQLNDRAWAAHIDAAPDPFAAHVDTEPEAAKPAWSDPAAEVVLPGETAPIAAAATLQVGPRVSEWADELLDQLVDVMARATRERLGAAVSEPTTVPSPSVVWERLVEGTGITAYGGDYARWLCRYAMADDDAGADREALREALTAVGTPGGAYPSGTEALREGPFAALTGAERTPTVVVRFDAPAWADADPRTAQRALDVLRDLARAADVHLVVSSTELARTLTEYELPECDFTDALDAARPPGGQSPEKPSLVERAWAVLDEHYDGGHGDLRILAHLPDDGPLYQSTLVEDPEVALGKSAVSRALGRLEERGLVERARDGSRKTVRLTPLGDAAGACIAPEAYRLIPPGQPDLDEEFTGPPQRSPGAVYRAQQARRRGEGARGAARPSAEDWLRDSAVVEEPADHVQWLGGPTARLDAYTMHRRYAAPAAGIVTCVDAPISDWSNEQGGGKVAYLSAFEDEALVLVQWGGPLATLARIVNALLSSKAFSKLVGPETTGWEFEDLRAGVDGPVLEAFEEAVATVLRDGMQLGWFSEDEHEWESFRDRLGGVRAFCLEKLGELAGSEDWEARSDLMRDLHGLLASATALYQAAGLDVIVNVRAPDTTHIVEDELRRRDFLEFFRSVVPKQALYRSVTGVHSHYRQAHETRPEKREWRLDLGFDADLGDVDEELRALATTEDGTHRLPPESESSVSWIVTGRTATALRPAIERSIDEEVAERVEAGEERAPFLDVSVVNGNGYASIKRIVRGIASGKGTQVAEGSAAQQAGHAESLDRLVRLCIAATSTGDRPHEGNPYTVAEALLGLARSTRAGDFLSVSDLEYAFSQVHPEEFLPGLAPTASAFVQVMLGSDAPVTRSEALEATGHSVSSWERALSGTETSAALRTLGLVEETTTNGTAAYMATLAPWWLDGRDPATGEPSSERRPPESGGDGRLSPASLERDIVLELAAAVDVPAELLEALSWPPDVGAVYQHAEVSAWRAWIWAAVASGDEYETGPPDVPSVDPQSVVRLGVSPAAAVLAEHQTVLARNAAVHGEAGELIPNVTDGGGEGPQ